MTIISNAEMRADDLGRIRTAGMTAAVTRRRLPVGAEVLPEVGVHFRVWAPRHKCLEVVFEGQDRLLGAHELEPEAGSRGYFSGTVEGARAGSLYRFRLGGGSGPLLADPASRAQPDGPHGPSQVVDPQAFPWTDLAWHGPARLEAQVLYELHVGTFTREGTFSAAARQLPYLKDLGITAVELMPVAEFPGEFGWSYDGVDLFAPFHGYGTPDDFRRFVDQAHALGLSVLLDVVYNHLGPEGNVLKQYSEDYFSSRHTTEWGEALNFDGENREPVREFVLANVGYWVGEFHIDGFRVDATQSLFDMEDSGDGRPHIVHEIAAEAHEAARRRDCRALLIGENEPQSARLFHSTAADHGYDMLWSDDFHHAAMVAAAGRREAYYHDYTGSPQEFISAYKRGWLYQGQWNLRQNKRRGTPALDVPPWAFVAYLQNHDQVANSGRGDRLHAQTTPGRYRALTALLLLGPGTPLIFQGQEFAASSPFLYFGDLSREVADMIWRGRKEGLVQFPSLATDEMQRRIPHPSAPEGFLGSKLDHGEREQGVHAESLALHRDLLRLRREDPTLSQRGETNLDGAVLGPEAFLIRWFHPEEATQDRLLVVNLGGELGLPVTAEPLLAPPEAARWRILWSSEDPRYGGSGTPQPEDEACNWRLPGHSAVLLAPGAAPGDERHHPPGSI